MWKITVPVISTVHLPGPDAHRDLPLVAHNVEEDIIFARIVDWDENYYPDWAEPICKWAESLPDYDGWIRFSGIGDEIDALPRYDDMWT